MMRQNGDELQGIQSVEIGLGVLDALVSAGGPMTLGDVARAADLSPSQARRYLISLVRKGVAAQDRETGRYDLGPGALRIGLSALGRVDAIEIATVALKELVADLHEGGTLSIWGDLGPTVVRWFRGGGIGVSSLGLGTVFPILSSATGRIFLSHLPRYAINSHLEREVGKTIARAPATAKDIEAIIAEVRRQGYATLEGHFVKELRGMAAPVFDSQNHLVAVIAIVGAKRAEREERRVTARLLGAAQSASRQLCARV